MLGEMAGTDVGSVPCGGPAPSVLVLVASETERNGTVPVVSAARGARPVPLGLLVGGLLLGWLWIAILGDVGVMTGVTAPKMSAAFICDGANSTNCLVKSPGGQPGTSSSSATLEKSRSLNGK